MISRPIKEGFKGVGRHWGMAVSSAIAVTITLIIISIFLLLTANVRNFTENIESSLDIYASVDFDYEGQEAALMKKIKAIDGVESVKLSTKEEEFDAYLNSFDDAKTREAFEPFKDDNPMHDAFYVTAKDGSYITSIAETLDAMKENGEGIFEVNYGGESTVNIVAAMKLIRRFGSVLVLGLTLLAIFLIQNTIKLTISTRAKEITIMRNVGATNGFIRSPFLIEGMLIGLMGSIIPVGLTAWGYYTIYNRFGGIVISNMFKLLPFMPFIPYLCVGLALIGILVGWFGSWLSVTRYLRWKR